MQRYINIPDSFINFEISPYLGEQNTVQFALNAKGKFPFDAGLLADQIAVYPKMRNKIPSFSGVYALSTPRSFEQASSERIALFKSRLIQGGALLDLSGGLGVDDWAFAKSFKEVVSIDIDADLNKIARKNFEKLNCHNISRLDANAYDFVDNCQRHFDLVYLDADRRTERGRGILFKDTEPNILAIKQKLFSLCEKIWLKVSPMYDISRLMEELGTVSKIWILAERNEVKELLVEVLPIVREQVSVCAVDIRDERVQQYCAGFNHPEIQPYKDEGAFLIEPSVALIKSGLVASYFNQNYIAQLGPNSYLGVIDQALSEVMGRQFRIVTRLPYSKSIITGYLKQQELHKANITKRNFPMEVAAIRKQFKIAEGGDDYLFFSTNKQGDKLFFHAVKYL